MDYRDKELDLQLRCYRMLKDIGLYRGDIETAVRGSKQPAERRKAA